MTKVGEHVPGTRDSMCEGSEAKQKIYLLKEAKVHLEYREEGES